MSGSRSECEGSTGDSEVQEQPCLLSEEGGEFSEGLGRKRGVGVGVSSTDAANPWLSYKILQQNPDLWLPF